MKRNGTAADWTIFVTETMILLQHNTLISRIMRINCARGPCFTLVKNGKAKALYGVWAPAESSPSNRGVCRAHGPIRKQGWKPQWAVPGTASLWKCGPHPSASTSLSPSPRLHPVPFCSFLLPPPVSAPPPTHFLAAHWLPRPGQDLSSDTLDMILAWLWLRSPRGRLLLWRPGMPCFVSYTPAGSATHALSHTQVLSSLSCSSKTPHTPSSHSLAASPDFPFSPSLPPPGPVPSACGLGPSLDQSSSLQPRSHLSLHTPLPSTHPPASSPLPGLLGAAGGKPARSHSRVRAPTVGCSLKAPEQTSSS